MWVSIVNYSNRQPTHCQISVTVTFKTKEKKFVIFVVIVTLLFLRNLQWAFGTGRYGMKTSGMTSGLGRWSRWYFNWSLNTSRWCPFSLWWSLVCIGTHLNNVSIFITLFWWVLAFVCSFLFSKILAGLKKYLLLILLNRGEFCEETRSGSRSV